MAVIHCNCPWFSDFGHGSMLVAKAMNSHPNPPLLRHSMVCMCSVCSLLPKRVKATVIECKEINAQIND